MTYTYDAFDRRIAQQVDADSMGLKRPQGRTSFTTAIRSGPTSTIKAGCWPAICTAPQLDELVARYRPGQGTAWYLTDHLGTVRDIADAAGNVVDRIDYDSFGNVLAESAPALGDRYKFTGREFDTATGLYYYRARYYDPQLGRFLSPDPREFDAGDGNLYRYVGNSPLTNTDPRGHAAVPEYQQTTSAVTLQLIRQKFTCIAEGLATSLPEIILTGGNYAAVDFAGEVVSCALLPVTAHANKAATKVILWLELKMPGGARKVARFVAKGGGGLSEFAIQAVLTCTDRTPPTRVRQWAGLPACEMGFQVSAQVRTPTTSAPNDRGTPSEREKSWPGAASGSTTPSTAWRWIGRRIRREGCIRRRIIEKVDELLEDAAKVLHRRIQQLKTIGDGYKKR